MKTIPDNLSSEAIRLLQGLLRCDTQSPPGNEILAANFIAAELASHGIASEILEADTGRASIVARLKADHASGEPIMLMGHTDVVRVEPEKWEHDPFGGEIDDDGFIWGRGALDMKNQVAGELAAFIALKESGIPLTRDVIFMAFADEESGGEFGADWVWKNHSDKINAEFAINEGGGDPLTIAGKRFYLCQVGEKGSTGLKMTVRGVPGHASTPITGTAMEKLGEAMDRLLAWQHATRMTKSVRLMLGAIGEAVGGDVEAQIDAVLAKETPTWEELSRIPLPDTYKAAFHAVTRDTAVPTMISGGQQINVMPGEITVNIDGRLLPESDPYEFLREAQEAVGDIAEVTFLYHPQYTGIEADPESDFFDTIRATMAEMDPDGVVIPSLIAGGTDASLLPGVKVYGFWPMRPTERLAIYDPLVHGHNERIHVDDVSYGVEFAYRFLLNAAGGQ